jgi:uncharacterized protein
MRTEERISQGNVELVLGGYARYNAGERTVGARFWHEDAEYRSAREDPESATYRGIDAIRQQFDRWHEAYPDLRAEVQQVKANGAHVFLWVRLTGHGAASGVPIDMQMAHVCTVRDGKVARLAEYLDRAEALAAVGLRD